MSNVLVAYFSAGGVTAKVAKGKRLAADISGKALLDWASQWL